MSFFHSIESVISVYVIIAIGYFLTRKGIFDTSTGGQFAWLVVNVTFPAYILAVLPDQFGRAEMGRAFYGILAAFAATAALYPVGYLTARIIRVEPSRRNVFVAMIVYSNVVFIGLPVNTALFGDSSVEFVLQYYVANTVIFWTAGVYFLQLGAGGVKPSVNFKKLLTNPPLLATAAAIALALLDARLPFVIKNPFQILGNMTTPLATLFMGIVFSEINLKDFRISKDMIAVMAGRFLISPLIIWGVVAFASFPPLLKEVFVIQAAMPVMNQVTISSKYYGADYKYSTVITVWSFIASMAAIPVYATIFG